jgi:hypothetical protein
MWKAKIRVKKLNHLVLGRGQVLTNNLLVTGSLGFLHHGNQAIVSKLILQGITLVNHAGVISQCLNISIRMANSTQVNWLLRWLNWATRGVLNLVKPLTTENYSIFVLHILSISRFHSIHCIAYTMTLSAVGILPQCDSIRNAI